MTCSLCTAAFIHFQSSVSTATCEACHMTMCSEPICPAQEYAPKETQQRIAVYCTAVSVLSVQLSGLHMVLQQQTSLDTPKTELSAKGANGTTDNALPYWNFGARSTDCAESQQAARMGAIATTPQQWQVVRAMSRPVIVTNSDGLVLHLGNTPSVPTKNTGVSTAA
jgi:hypothetical protein